MLRDTHTIFLVGSRACGKTTVGTVLARRLQNTFTDTDSLVQQNVGCSVAHMVAEHGWNFFRAEESKALHEATQRNGIIATGGGMVLSPQNRDYMRTHGTVVFLSVPPDILVQRLVAQPNKAQRPSLTAQNEQYEHSIQDEVHSVLAARLPLYHEVAHHIVDATQSTTQIAKNIVRLLKCKEHKSID